MKQTTSQNYVPGPPRIAITTLAFAATFMLLSCNPFNDPPPQKQTYTENIGNSTFTVSPGSWRFYTVNVTSQMESPRVTGTFTASGGSGNDIYVFVMDQINYTNWSNGHSSSALYNSGKVTTGNISAYFPSSGTYYIVYSNHFSTTSSKSVTTYVDLKYEM